MAYVIGDDCIACGTCQGECPVEAISEGEKYSIIIQQLSKKISPAFRRGIFYVHFSNYFTPRICLATSLSGSMAMSLLA